MFKRLFSVLAVVALSACMLILPASAVDDLSVASGTDFVPFFGLDGEEFSVGTFSSLIHPVSIDSSIPLNTNSGSPYTGDYDFILYRPDLVGGNYQYTFYFCKTDQVVMQGSNWFPVPSDRKLPSAYANSGQGHFNYYPDSILITLYPNPQPFSSGSGYIQIGKFTPPVDPDPEEPPIVIPPVNMGFVPWDLDRLAWLYAHIKKAIGVAVNVSFILFALILAVYIMKRIILIFERTSGGGDKQ